MGIQKKKVFPTVDYPPKMFLMAAGNSHGPTPSKKIARV